MRTIRPLAVALAAVALVGFPVYGTQSQGWSFDGVDRVVIDGVSGDLVVQAASGSGVTLELEEDVRPAGRFRAEVEESGGTVVVREDWRGRGSGSVTWTLTVPAGFEIEFETASGNFEAAGVNARTTFDTASGDVRISDATIAAGSSFDTASGDIILTDVTVEDDVDFDTASGDLRFSGVSAGDDFSASTASGDVRVERSEGGLSVSTASGNVSVGANVLTGGGRFSSASGDVEAEIEELPGDGLELSSASGDVVLTAPFGADYTLVMTVRKDRGDINSPFEPTSEEEFRRNGNEYVRQTVVRGSGSPEIRLTSASGTIRVRDR